MQNHPELQRRLWLFSRRGDFWLACGGASTAILAAIALIFLHGDREIDAIDFVLSEFHLGATYDAVVRRRLWRRMPADVVAAPLLIVAVTYGLAAAGHEVLLTSIAMYAAVWHRGRQSFGVARYYQRQGGGPVSRTHDLLFQCAIYLPMVAAVLVFTDRSPRTYEGEAYLALDLGARTTALAGIVAAVAVAAYLAFALWQNRAGRVDAHGALLRWMHPGEWWVVLAHAAAFGSSYALGATNASFLLVLAVHHEIQYLYFAYAMARRAAGSNAASACAATPLWRREAFALASFLVWPVIGFSGAIAGSALQLSWLAPLALGGLYSHYWLDGRIWTRRAIQH